MFWIILGLLVFRWPLFKRFLGTKRMYLCDALLMTAIAALNLANPGTWGWLGYVVGVACALVAFFSARSYLMIDAAQKAENEQGSDDGTASGS